MPVTLKSTPKMRSWYSFIPAIISGFTLALAFPPVSQTDAAWFALVPLLLALRRSDAQHGMRLGFVSGLAFWLLDLAWLWKLKDNGGPLPLVILGHLALSAWCAVFFAVFGRTVAWIWHNPKRTHSAWSRLLLAIIAEPILWIGVEYLRGVLFTGFAWNPLAACQYRNLALLHCISWFGTGALSWLIVAVNAGIASMLARIWTDVVPQRLKTGNRKKEHNFPIRSAELTTALVATVACWSCGITAVRDIDRATQKATQWRIALIHPDSPCIFERDDDSLTETRDNILNCTALAGDTEPDFCVWPETQLPGYLPYDEEPLAMTASGVRAANAPILAGGVECEFMPQKISGSITNAPEYRIYNSAFLFGRGGAIYSTYRKQHLVPFGEYIPFESKLKFLKKLAPAGFSCEAGTNSVAMKIPKGSSSETLNASPLICFEDTLPYLSRAATQNGADLLVCLANDAWFDGSCEAEQHLAQAVLRSVENHRPVARSTNCGVTAMILPNGRIVRRIGDGRGSGSSGFIVHSMGIEPQQALTLYSRGGDWLLHIPAMLLTLTAAMASLQQRPDADDFIDDADEKTKRV